MRIKFDQDMIRLFQLKPWRDHSRLINNALRFYYYKKNVKYSLDDDVMQLIRDRVSRRGNISSLVNDALRFYLSIKQIHYPSFRAEDHKLTERKHITKREIREKLKQEEEGYKIHHPLTTEKILSVIGLEESES